MEEHGVKAAFDDLANAVLPSAWNVAAEPGSRDLRLVAGASAIDAGTALPNLNDPFVADGGATSGCTLYWPGVLIR